MTTYNRSNIFKRAWEIKRRNHVAYMSYKADDILTFGGACLNHGQKQRQKPSGTPER